MLDLSEEGRKMLDLSEEGRKMLDLLERGRIKRRETETAEGKTADTLFR